MIVQHYQFNLRLHEKFKIVAEYVAAVCKLTKHRSFGETLDEMVQDGWCVALPALQFRNVCSDNFTGGRTCQKGSKEFNQLLRTSLKTYTSFQLTIEPAIFGAGVQYI